MSTTDWWDGAVRIIDQTRLPEAVVVLDVRDVDDLVGHIRSPAVPGAMVSGVAGAMGMALAAANADWAGSGLDRALDVTAEKLTQARPTAVKLGYGDRAVRQARAEGTGAAGLLLAALAIRDQDLAASRAVVERGALVLAGARRILTHCNTGALSGVEQGTAVGIIGWLLPFLVAAPESTVDVHTYTGSDIPIEFRDENEVLNLPGRRVAPAASHALNPAFDVTPAELITAIVTERRVLRSPVEHPPAPPKTQLPAQHSPRSML